MCVDLGHCVTDFWFFLIERQEGLREPLDGILGLSRNRNMYITPGEETEIGPLYLEAL